MTTVTPLSDQGAATEDRLRRLVAAGIALSSELSLESLLERVITAAAELTEASFGALGVIDASGSSLEQFITVGIGEETRRSIGDPPLGRGILGALIERQEALRLDDLSRDRRSVGLPAGHPPMTSFLGVPIVLRGAAFGNLYLTEKKTAEGFTSDDEDIVRLLAAQAAVAIENARLYESVRRWSRQLEALDEIGMALVTEPDRDRLLELAVTRLRELLDCRIVLFQLPSADEAALTVGAVSGHDAEELRAWHLDRRRSKAGLTLDRRRSERIDALLDDPEVDQGLTRLLRASSALYLPLLGRDGPLGILVAYDKHGPGSRFSDGDLRTAEAFAGRAAIALELWRARQAAPHVSGTCDAPNSET